MICALRRHGARLFALAFVAVGLSACGINNVPQYDEETKAAWSEVLNQYQRRSDLVPNLVETVTGYAQQERQTLTAVVEARAKATQMQLPPDILTEPGVQAVPGESGRADWGVGALAGRSGTISRPQIQSELPVAAVPA